MSTTTETTASRQITDEVTSWAGVEAGHGRRGEFAFKLRGREIGHLHGDHSAHFSFPKDVWHELHSKVGSPSIPSSRAGLVPPPGGSAPTRTSAT
jgi:hypothetical protein